MLATTARGIAWVAYVRPAGAATFSLWLRRGHPGQPWSAPIAVSTGRANEFFPRPALAADDAGRAVVVYTTRTSPLSGAQPLLLRRFR